MTTTMPPRYTYADRYEVAGSARTGSSALPLGAARPITAPNQVAPQPWSLESAYLAPALQAPSVQPSLGTDLARLAGSDSGRRLDWARYWTGTALTMVVAALLGSVALVIAQGVFHQHLLVADGGSAVALSVGVYALAAAALAGIASLLFAAIMHLAPRPGMYFGWIGGLATLLALVTPFTMSTSLQAQVILAGINAAVGAVIVLLVPLAAVLRSDTQG